MDPSEAKATVPVAEEATARNSSAVVSLGELGRVEVTQTREHVLLARTGH